MTSRTLALTLLTAAMALSSAARADTGLTREQVKADLAQAQRTGDLVDYETGLKQNQLFPGAYPATTATATSTAAKTASEQLPVLAVETLPPTSAGVARPAHQRVRLNSALPWDYEAISQRSAEALARGGRSF